MHPLQCANAHSNAMCVYVYIYNNTRAKIHTYRLLFEAYLPAKSKALKNSKLQIK